MSDELEPGERELAEKIFDEVLDSVRPVGSPSRVEREAYASQYMGVPFFPAECDDLTAAREEARALDERADLLSGRIAALRAAKEAGPDALDELRPGRATDRATTGLLGALDQARDAVARGESVRLCVSSSGEATVARTEDEFRSFVRGALRREKLAKLAEAGATAEVLEGLRLAVHVPEHDLTSADGGRIEEAGRWLDGLLES